MPLKTLAADQLQEKKQGRLAATVFNPLDTIAPTWR